MGFVSFQTIFHPCSDYYQIAQNDDDDGKSVEAEVEQGHDPAPGRDQGESSRPHGNMAPWHHGTAATFQNAAKTKLESSLDVQTRIQFGRSNWIQLDVQTKIQFGHPN